MPTNVCDDKPFRELVETLPVVTYMRDARVAALVVVVVGKSLAGLELIEAALRDDGHRVLTTTKPEEVVALARSIRIDVLIGDRGDALVALEQELRLVQPNVRAASNSTNTLRRDRRSGRETAVDHRAIYDALVARDANMAAAADLMHLRISEDWLRRVVDGRDGTA
jgi:hypothetical protein